MASDKNDSKSKSDKGQTEENTSATKGTELTINQLAKVVGQAVKAVDSYVYVFDRFCAGTKDGGSWMIRTLCCWIGIMTPWSVYMYSSWSRILDNSGTGSSPFPEHFTPLVSFLFLIGVLPIVASIVVTHKEKLSYCNSFVGHGGRIGGYTLMTALVGGLLF